MTKMEDHVPRDPRRTAIGGLALALAVGLASPALAETLTIALPTDVNTLDPHKTATVGTDLSVISHIYTPLIMRAPDLSLRPAAARSWEAVDDTTWRFELRPDLTFANGEPLDAEAVKWNIERILDPAVNARIRAWYTPIEEVRVISPTELEIETAEPYPALPAQLSSTFLLAPGWASENDPATSAVGSGPYALEEFVSGDRIVLTARDDYWGETPPFDTVVFRPIPEIAASIAALLAGDVDVITNVPPFELERLRREDGIAVGGRQGTRNMHVKYNNLKEPLASNKALRQALNYAVDKEGIIDGLFEGLVEPANCQVLMDGYFGYNPDLEPYPYNPDKARELVREAGFADGLELDLEVPLGRYLLASEIGQIVAAQLAEVGVTVNIVEMQFGPWLKKYREAGNLGDMSYIGQAWPTLDADGLLTLYEAGNKYAYWPNEEFAGIIREARSTTDQDRRRELYHEATELMCDEAPVIFLFNQPETYAIDDRIDWDFRSDSWIRAMDMRLAE